MLIVVEGQPDSIRPAMRPGIVLDVRGWTMEEAQKLVAAANEMHTRKLEREVRSLTARTERLMRELSRYDAAGNPKRKKPKGKRRRGRTGSDHAVEPGSRRGRTAAHRRTV